MKRRRARGPTTQAKLNVAMSAILVLNRRVSKLERHCRRLEGDKEPIGFTFVHGDQAESEEEGEWEIDTTETCRRRG